MNIRLAQDSHDILINQTGKTDGKLLDVHTSVLPVWFPDKVFWITNQHSEEKKISSFNCASQMGGYDITTFWLPVQTRAPTCQTKLVIFRMNNFQIVLSSVTRMSLNF